MFTPNISTGDSPSRCFDKNGIGTIARQELHSIFEVSSKDDSWHFKASLTYRILENILKRRRLRDFWTKQTRARASLSTQNSVTSRIWTDKNFSLYKPFKVFGQNDPRRRRASLLPSFNGPLSIKIWNQVSCNLFYFGDRKCLSDTLLLILESLQRKCLDRQRGYFSGSTLSKRLPPDISRYWTRDVN